jgi:hypothetical protein
VAQYVINDGNDVREALARAGASCEDVIPASSRPANRIGLVLIQPQRLAFALVLARSKNPGALGMQDSLGYQIIDCAGVLK